MEHVTNLPKYFDFDAPLGFSALHLRMLITPNLDAACNSTVYMLHLSQKLLTAELNGKKAHSLF